MILGAVRSDLNLLAQINTSNLAVQSYVFEIGFSKITFRGDQIVFSHHLVICKFKEIICIGFVPIRAKSLAVTIKDLLVGAFDNLGKSELLIDTERFL